MQKHNNNGNENDKKNDISTDLALGEKIALAIAHSYIMTGFIPLTQDVLSFFPSSTSAGNISASNASSHWSDESVAGAASSHGSSLASSLLSSQVVSALNQSFHSLTTRRTH